MTEAKDYTDKFTKEIEQLKQQLTEALKTNSESALNLRKQTSEQANLQVNKLLKEIEELKTMQEEIQE